MKNLFVAAALGLSLAGCASSTGMFGAGMADNNAGARHANDGEFALAEARLNSALEANANNPYVLNNLGYVYQRTGRPDEARAMYQRVLALRTNKRPATSYGSYKGAVDAQSDSFDAVARINLEALNSPGPRTIFTAR